MSNIQRRYIKLLDNVFNIILQLNACLPIQCGKGFIKEQDIRFPGYGPDQGNSLFLPAGQLCGIVPFVT